MNKKNLVITVFLVSIFSCNSSKNTKSGRQLLTENCISCHNYNNDRSMYKPSITEMKNMGPLFRKVFYSALSDSNHLELTQKLSSRDRDSIYEYILSWSNSFEDHRYRK